MVKVSLDRLLNAARRGSVLFRNTTGGCSASRHINEAFEKLPLHAIVGVYDSRVEEDWLVADLAYAGFQAEII